MELDSTLRYAAENADYEYSIADDKDALKVAQEALQYKLFHKTAVPFPEPKEHRLTYKTNFSRQYGC